MKLLLLEKIMKRINILHINKTNSMVSRNVMLLNNVFGNLWSKNLTVNFFKTRFSSKKNIEFQEFKNAHDIFMMLDNKEVYHIGASLKDLGKKWFAFSKFEMGALEILGRLE